KGNRSHNTAAFTTPYNFCQKKCCHSTRSTISKWESGTYEPEINSLKRLSEAFNISIDDLIFIDLRSRDQPI
ncbi:helix-turn-helix transcriptional regulator, partial [Enterococcus avium]|uniref:helix-turn-helix transcriptional regulator n=1 Tax=Enterococcus avium TaxID=33945 RepID=UPI00288D6F29